MIDLLYEKLGIDPSSLEGLTEEKANEIIGNIENGFKSKILENEDFYKSLDENKIPSDFKNKYLSEGTAKIAGLTKKSLDKEFGLTEEDKSKFAEEDLKNIDKYISKVKTIYSDKVNAGSKDVGSLQNEILTLRQTADEYETKFKTLDQQYEEKLTKSISEKESEFLTMMEVGKMSSNIIGNIGATFKLVYPTLTEKYSIVNEGGVPSIRKKDNSAFKVEYDNGGKKEYMTMEKAIELEYKALGLWKEKEEPRAPRTVTINGDFNDRSIPNNMREIIAEEKSFLQS